MEVNARAVHNRACSPQEKSMEEMRQRLFYVSRELDETKAAAREELKRRDVQMAQLRGLLEATARERDEALDKYRKAFHENLFLQQQIAAAAAVRPVSGISGVEDEPRRAVEKDSSNVTFTGGLSTSDCEDSIVSSSPIADLILPPPCKPTARSYDSLPVPEKLLPEKGKLLQAVMKAGPLLQTLLLAGPLPQWQHPPPLLETSEIPPVKISSIPLPQLPPPLAAPPLFLQDSHQLINANITTSCGRVCHKRGLSEGLFDFPTETKYQRVALL